MKLKKIQDFLLLLKDNNNKEWFQANKNQYQEAKNIFINFIDTIIIELNKIDNSLVHIDAKDCIFRINRDIRFSKDKTPYKTNFGASISMRGKSGLHASYYIQMEGQKSFIGGGVYAPESKILKAIRTEIYENPQSFVDIINNNKFQDKFGNLYGEKLKTAPRGFPKDFEHIALLNHKHYAAIKNIPDEITFSNKFSSEILNTFRTLKPLINYINKIITNMD